MLGISVDPLDASARMAAREGIDFPLLRDADLAVSRAYVGVDDNDLPVPGVVIVRTDGSIAHRQIATGKADRLSTAALLALLDGDGSSGPAMRGGYAPLDRIALGVDLAGGFGESGAVATLGTRLDVPLSRHLLLGARAEFEATTARMVLAGAVTGRLPIWADLGTLSLGVRGGRAVVDLTGWHAAARAAMGFALRPSWGIEVGLDVGAYRLGDDVAWEATAGVSLLHLVRLGDRAVSR